MLQLISRSLRRRRVKVTKPFGKGWASDRLRVSLCDRGPDVVRALADRFHDAPGVEVIEGDLFNLDADALVSPANSFGDMGGGIDQRIDTFYNGSAQPAVMARIADEFLGELPVGMAVVVEMTSRRFPFLVVAPTMRIQGRVGGTINAYLALRAALVAVSLHNCSNPRRIGSLAVPGLCTGVGGMSPEHAAVQMRSAYDSVIGGLWREVKHPALAPFARSI
jgi:O-acetyl-ADP-ribose deacetylase (regulator of RNase III)